MGAEEAGPAMDERTAADVDPGRGYVADEPAYALIRERVGPGSTVLDIGCGHGNVGAYLAEAGAVVDGIEPDAARAAAAEAKLHQVCVAPLAGAIGSRLLRPAYDVVTMIDVVEHVASPVELLRQAATFLAPEGRLFLFVPNSAHWSARKKIARGDWSYADWGLFDRTHLRFFDRTTAAALGPAAGLVETDRWDTSPGTTMINRYGMRWWPELFAFHFLFELRLPAAPGVR